MGVLLVGPRPPPTGGIASHLFELTRALRARDVPTTLVDPRHDAPDGDGRPRLLVELARAAARGDLVHAHINGHHPKSWTLAALSSAPSRLARPCLLTVHSGLAPAFIAAHASRVRAVCARFARVIAVNAELADALARAGVDAERLVVAPAFSSESLAFRLSPPGLGAIRRRHPTLIAAAVVPSLPEYGADVLLDGFMHVHQKLMHVHHEFDASALAIYGPGTRAPAFAAEVERRGLKRAVYLFGELARERALAVVAAADLFVRPSRADGDALSVREAVSLGTPVVASNVGCRPPQARLFSVGDARSMAEQIFHALSNRHATDDTVAASSPDGIAALLGIYRRHGAAVGAETTGTAIATPVTHVWHRWSREPERPGGSGRAVPHDGGDRSPRSR
jgi:glycosyltransferase involved in cell wall biosynthesis